MKYMNSNKKIPMYIAVQLESGDRRVWLPLPATRAQFNAAVEKIGGLDYKLTIRDYAVKVPMMSVYKLMRVPLSMANFLAARLNKLTDDEILKLCAICDTESYYFDHIGQYIDYTYMTDCYKLLPGVCDEEALGAYYIGDSKRVIADAMLKQCIDRHEFGKKLAALENGAFTPHGYITSEIGWNLLRKERNVPESLRLKGAIGEELYGEWEDFDFGA